MTHVTAFIGEGFDGTMYEYSDGSEADLVPGPVAAIKHGVSERLSR